MYKFKDKVKIIKGFYEGYSGTVEEESNPSGFLVVYKVQIIVNPEDIGKPYYPLEYKTILIYDDA